LLILDLHGGAMIVSRRAEDITVATMLARLKLHEVQLDIEKEMSKGTFPSDEKSMEGDFDEPHERYKWTAVIKKVEIPVPPQPEGAGEEAGLDVMLKAFKMIAEQIGESAREIRVDVKWEDLGEEQAVSVATHIVKL